MNKIAQLFFVCLCLTTILNAQNATDKNFKLTAPNNPAPFAETITQADMKAILSVLAADDMEGRETGTPGNAKAAKFIASKLAEIGIPEVEKLGGYFQNIAFTSESWSDIKLEVANKPFRHLWEYYSFSNLNSDRAPQIINEVVFLGYGIDDANYSDYKGKNVKGCLLYTSPSPRDQRGSRMPSSA